MCVERASEVASVIGRILYQLHRDETKASRVIVCRLVSHIHGVRSFSDDTSLRCVPCSTATPRSLPVHPGTVPVRRDRALVGSSLWIQWHSLGVVSDPGQTVNRNISGKGNTAATTQRQQHSGNNTAATTQRQQHSGNNTAATKQRQQHSGNNTAASLHQSADYYCASRLYIRSASPSALNSSMRHGEMCYYFCTATNKFLIIGSRAQ